ncbi:SixA phosphatase family protein [Halalkalibaculum sp. DA3122]|uniref:SixA phosphatase family protein n=1 Tax=unclassified Halalkalibaculum TaxID=2964617 RepID=UPI00375432C8
MKQILLLRHAKSSWEIPHLKDFDRPLAARGQKDAPRMGRFLKKTGYLPGLVISSPAERAKETTQLCLEAAGLDEDLITWNDNLYYGTAGDYLDAIQQVPKNIECIMLVGHNPKMEDIASSLGGEANIRVPTAALICFEQPANRWDQIIPGHPQLKWIMIPKLLKKLI